MKFDQFFFAFFTYVNKYTDMIIILIILSNLSLTFNRAIFIIKLPEHMMALMTISEVAEFLAVQDVRVERLERESLLLAKDKDENGKALFDRADVERYKELAERLGGI